MHYLLLVKQVPDDLKIYLDRESGLLRRSTAGVQMDPASRNAIEYVLQTRAEGDTVAVMTKGPERAAEVLRQAVAMGCDTAYHLSDPEFEGSDLLATARTLVAAIRHVRNPAPDVIVLGDRSADGRTGTIGPMLSEALGWPLDYAGAAVVAQRVIVVPEGFNTPRTPKAIQVMKASKQPVTTWKRDDLGLEPDQIGLRGSATRVIRSEKVEVETVSP
jgi:electron transfer flavoprotein beta subunit